MSDKPLNKNDNDASTRAALGSAHNPVDMLSALAPDILWQILGYVTWQDIVRFRQCSKWLSGITKGSAAWFPLFQERLHEFEIPTLCLRGTDLDPNDFEKVVCGYHRFVATASRWVQPEISTEQHHRTDEALPRTVVAQVHSIPEMDALGEKISALRLVQGGRLLIVTSTSIIQLWDLGISEPYARCIASCTRVSTPREEGSSVEEGKMRETHIFIPQIKVVDGSLLFLLTLGAFDRPGSFHSALLYSINPEATSPEFHCNGRFSSLASKTTIYGFVGDKVIFSSLNSQNQQYIGVWYWKQDITFIWDSGWPTVYDVNFLEDINLLVSTTMGFDEVDCYHCPTLSEHPNARSGQVNEIENKELYYCPWGSELTALGERLFITPIAPTPAAFPEYPLKSQKPYRWEWLMKLKAPEESANEFSGNVILFDQVWIEKWGSSQSEFPVWWAPKIVKSTEIPASQIGTGKLDLPYSLSMGEPREWRIMWWEDAESERILRFCVLDKTGSTHAGVLEKVNSSESTSNKDITLPGPLNYNLYSFTPLLGRTCLAHEDKGGFNIVEYI